MTECSLSGRISFVEDEAFHFVILMVDILGFHVQKKLSSLLSCLTLDKQP